MYAIDITFGLFIVLFTILLLRWIRTPRLQLSGFRSQRMCPSCGLITSRLKSRCLECGKTFTTAE
jgi:predicted amidophosphoribosyltransferase